jgi:hypothetical protein
MQPCKQVSKTGTAGPLHRWHVILVLFFSVRTPPREPFLPLFGADRHQRCMACPHGKKKKAWCTHACFGFWEIPSKQTTREMSLVTVQFGSFRRFRIDRRSSSFVPTISVSRLHMVNAGDSSCSFWTAEVFSFPSSSTSSSHPWLLH